MFDAFNVDIINAKESPENRVIRAELRLSCRWKVVGKRVEMVRGERPDDEYNPTTISVPELKSKEHISRGAVEIYVTAAPGQRYRCPGCGCSCKPISYRERRLHHLPEQGCECSIIARVPKLLCRNCGGTPILPFPMCDKRVSYTRDLAEDVLCELTHSPKTSVASDYFISTDIIDGMVEHYIRDALKEQNLSDTTGVYLDETQYGKGQDYISVFLNQRHKVIFICRGHGKDVLELFCSHLVIQGGDPDNIHFFSTDMSVAYEAGIMKHFRNATLIWDRFHLVKSINEALNDVRKRTLKKSPEESLAGVKYVVLRHFQTQSEEQQKKMDEIRMVNPELALGFDMKEIFCDIILTRDRNSMESMLRWWIRWVREEGPAEFVKKVNWFELKLDRILNWTTHPISNSVAEGVNKNIQDIRRQGCGYRNVQNFFYMILLRQSELVLRL